MSSLKYYTLIIITLHFTAPVNYYLNMNSDTVAKDMLVMKLEDIILLPVFTIFRIQYNQIACRTESNNSLLFHFKKSMSGVRSWNSTTVRDFCHNLVQKFPSLGEPFRQLFSELLSITCKILGESSDSNSYKILPAETYSHLHSLMSGCSDAFISHPNWFTVDEESTEYQTCINNAKTCMQQAKVVDNTVMDFIQTSPDSDTEGQTKNSAKIHNDDKSDDHKSDNDKSDDDSDFNSKNRNDKNVVYDSDQSNISNPKSISSASSNSTQRGKNTTQEPLSNEQGLTDTHMEKKNSSSRLGEKVIDIDTGSCQQLGPTREFSSPFLDTSGDDATSPMSVPPNTPNTPKSQDSATSTEVEFTKKKNSKNSTISEKLENSSNFKNISKSQDDLQSSSSSPLSNKAHCDSSNSTHSIISPQQEKRSESKISTSRSASDSDMKINKESSDVGNSSEWGSQFDSISGIGEEDEDDRVADTTNMDNTNLGSEFESESESEFGSDMMTFLSGSSDTDSSSDFSDSISDTDSDNDPDFDSDSDDSDGNSDSDDSDGNSDSDDSDGNSYSDDSDGNSNSDGNSVSDGDSNSDGNSKPKKKDKNFNKNTKQEPLLETSSTSSDDSFFDSDVDLTDDGFGHVHESRGKGERADKGNRGKKIHKTIPRPPLLTKKKTTAPENNASKEEQNKSASDIDPTDPVEAVSRILANRRLERVARNQQRVNRRRERRRRAQIRARRNIEEDTEQELREKLNKHDEDSSTSS